MAKTGRKTKYDESYHAPVARCLAMMGKTSDEIAVELGVARSTLYGWMGAHPEFSDAIKRGKAFADAQVVETLYNKATGRLTKTVKRKRDVLDPNKGKVTLTEVTEESIPPDTASMIFWLKNRQPEMWSDRPKQDDTDTAVLKAAKELVSGVQSAIG